MDCPSWLNETFLETILQEKPVIQHRVKIIKYSVNPGVEAGYNVTSKIYKLDIHYKVKSSNSEESIVILVKEPNVKGILEKLSNEINFFGAEPKVYAELLPKMYEKIKLEFGPKSYICPLKNGVILKDLRPEGFIVANKYDQLDFAHCKIVLSTLAKFHATSVACYHDNPKLIRTVGEEHFIKAGPSYEKSLKPWIEYSARYLLNALIEIGDQQWMINWLKERVELAADSLINICKPKVNGLNVLNHGDCWTNNMLFKYNNREEIVDFRFIDFQLSRFASPVLDVTFFIWTSAKEIVREKRLLELYNIYLCTLNETLENLGCEERMTLEEFQSDIKSSGDWFIFTVGLTFAIVMCCPEDAVDLGEFTADDFKRNEKFQNMFRNKRYRALLPALARQWQAAIS